ncbi:MAG: hypothetical protein AAFW01_09180 [Pseudomonadota bacterium]
MQSVYAVLYLIQLVGYGCLLVFFRLYLFLIFLTKDGARWVFAIVAAGAGIGFQGFAAPFVDPVLAGWIDPLVAQLKPEHVLVEVDAALTPRRYEIALGTIIFAGMVLITWSGWLLRPILAALPMPARPLPPILRRVTPRHVIRAVLCRSTVPRLPLRYYGGERPALVRRLPSPLTALLAAPPMLPAPEERSAVSLEASSPRDVNV